MRLILSLLAVVMMCALAANPALAQIYGTGKASDYDEPTYSPQARPYYNKMVRDALKNKPPGFDFMQLRVYYSQTPQYDPLSEEALDQLNNYAYIVMNDPDPDRVKSAQLAYQTVVTNHLANIDVILQALSLAKQDKRFGKPAFFEWMRAGLMKSVTISGDGNSLQGAYDVIVMQEETILLHRLGYKLLETLPRRESIIYYNMHDVVDVQTGEKKTIFVNTSIPMRVLEERKKYQDRNLTLDIRKQ